MFQFISCQRNERQFIQHMLVNLPEVSDGVEASDDPVLGFRSAASAVSFLCRRNESSAKSPVRNIAQPTLRLRQPVLVTAG